MSLEFQFSSLSQAVLLDQLKSSVDAYASQSGNVYSNVPSGFLYEIIDPSSIKSAIQISSIAPVTPTTTSTAATTTNNKILRLS